MNLYFNLANIKLIIFTDHLMELSVMLAGTMLISFFAGNFFAKTGKAKKATKEETAEILLTSPPEEVKVISAISSFEEEVNNLHTKTKEDQAETQNLKQQLQKHLMEIVTLENRLDIFARTVTMQKESLSEKEKAIAEYQTQSAELNNTIVQLRDGNKKLNDELTGLIQAPVSVTEVVVNNENKSYAAEIVSQLEHTVASLTDDNKSLQQKLTEAEEQLHMLQFPGGLDENSMINILQDKITTVQKEKSTFLQQLKNLENQFVVNHLASLSKVEFPEESEQNPFRRIALYIRMVEGEKTGLQNKISDITKKLQMAEAGIKHLSATENELSFIKARINALEQDKKEYSSKAGEWETMYRKLHEKTVYIISSKETEIEQLKTNISYLEKDKTSLLKRLTSLENDFKSNTFFKTDKPLVFNL